VIAAAHRDGGDADPAAHGWDDVGLLWDGIVYLSLADVCQRFGLSRYALRKIRREHGLKRYGRYGDHRRYLRLADLVAAIRLAAVAVTEDR
jgi:hypothetical protein